MRLWSIIIAKNQYLLILQLVRQGIDNIREFNFERKDVAINLIKNFGERVKRAAGLFLPDIDPLKQTLIDLVRYSERKAEGSATPEEIAQYGETIYIERADGTLFSTYKAFRDVWQKVADVTYDADLFLARNRCLVESHNMTLFAFLMGDRDITIYQKPQPVYLTFYDYLDTLSRGVVYPGAMDAHISLYEGKQEAKCYKRSVLGKVFDEKPEGKEDYSNHINLKVKVPLTEILMITSEQLDNSRRTNPPYIKKNLQEEEAHRRAEEARRLEEGRRLEQERAAREQLEADRREEERRRLEQERAVREQQEAKRNAPRLLKDIFRADRSKLEKFGKIEAEIKRIQECHKQGRNAFGGWDQQPTEHIMAYSRAYENLGPQDLFESGFNVFLNPKLEGVLKVSSPRDMSALTDGNTLKAWLLEKYQNFGGHKPSDTVNYIFTKWRDGGFGYNTFLPALNHFHGFVTLYGQDPRYQEDIEILTNEVMVKMQEHLNHCGDGAQGRGFLIDWELIKIMKKAADQA